ncbi:MAG: penicillin-binding protein 1C [bacterium JZ-2024 1]
MAIGSGIIVGGILVLGHIAIRVLPLPAGINPEFSVLVTYEDGEIVRAFLTRDEKWRIWAPLHQIDPRLVAGTICYEDRYFWWHPGVNPGAIARALYQNIRMGRVVSGGSTLTMQVARMAERRPRTWVSKILEALRAVQYEARLGKREILAHYLNHAPYGGNYEGVASASIAYFGKPPTHLTASEIAYLVSLPQSPTRRRPGAGERARAARDRVLARLKQCGVITEKEYDEALQTELPKRVRGLPVRAPVTAEYYRARYGSLREVRTTLSRRVQGVAEDILVAHRTRIRSLGAYNAAVVVIENKSRKVRALVGTLDYRDEAHAGKMMGFDVMRSPGSALKPFLYALALQEGQITTATMLEDVPAPVSGFLPSNFSGTYRGLVSAEFALAHSLNYPFVKLARQVTVEKFLGLTDRLGFTRPKGLEYGLTAITGGLEVRLLDLTNAYVTFGRGGKYGPPRLVAGEPLVEQEVLTPGAVTLTLEGLSQRGRPDAPADGMVEDAGRPTVYWKTGTSWGRRDAWSIGLTADYTVGVWVGNLSGRGADDITGSRAAGPVLFDLLYALGSHQLKIPEATEDLETVQVCALSGLPPNEHCGELKRVRIVRDHLPAQQCPYHRAFIVERKTGDLACPTKAYPEGELTHKVVAVIPLLARAFMSLPPEGVPPVSPECGGSPETTLQMVRPTPGATYLMSTGVRGAKGIVMEAYTTEHTGDIYWFVNGRFVTKTKSGESYVWHLEPGVLHIVAVDATGNASRATVTVVSPHS